MSDLAATNCGCGEERSGCGCGNCGCNNGCGCDNGCGLSFGNGSCGCNILWIIILLCACGGNGIGCNNSCGNGNGDCCWIIIILLLLCGGWGNGCGCCSEFPTYEKGLSSQSFSKKSGQREFSPVPFFRHILKAFLRFLVSFSTTLWVETLSCKLSLIPGMVCGLPSFF